jgi:hypothetical protein
MQPASYTCQACGHSFSADPAIVAKQPTCPKCRTFGKLTGGPVRMPAGLRNPAAAKIARRHEPSVEVSADVVYGKQSNPKSVISGVVLVILGLGIVGLLYFIITTFTEDRAERAKQQKEVVLDKKEFGRAVDDAVSQARTLLASIPEVEIRETTDFTAAMAAIREAGGSAPAWNQGLRPGKPFKAHGFEITAPDKRTGTRVVGFVMLLYYTTAQEVDAAYTELDRELRAHNTNITVHISQPTWFVAYGGASYGGELHDRIRNAMARAQPSSFKQFTDRVGATWSE